MMPIVSVLRAIQELTVLRVCQTFHLFSTGFINPNASTEQYLVHPNIATIMELADILMVVQLLFVSASQDTV
jgi:hypothetical protein